MGMGIGGMYVCEGGGGGKGREGEGGDLRRGL